MHALCSSFLFLGNKLGISGCRSRSLSYASSKSASLRTPFAQQKQRSPANAPSWSVQTRLAHAECLMRSRAAVAEPIQWRAQDKDGGGLEANLVSVEAVPAFEPSWGAGHTSCRARTAWDVRTLPPGYWPWFGEGRVGNMAGCWKMSCPALCSWRG